MGAGPRWAAVGAGALAALAVLAFLDPAETAVFPPCPFHVLTGLHCPGCGSLRGLHELLNGHPVRALDSNALMVACLPLLGYGLLSRLVGRLQPLAPRAVWVWALLVAVVAFWILRNLPGRPFALLAP